VIQPLTYGAGKVAVLGERARVALACGDSYQGDLALLQAAEVAVAVAPDAGSPLASEARQRGWFVLDQDS
jgi:phosphoserine phosphatase